MRVGTRVKLNPNLHDHDFRYTQGPVRHGEIGRIISIVGDKITVNFPSHNSWNGLESELILANAATEEDNIHCSICGELITGDYEEVDGDPICTECFGDNYCYCDVCGRVESNDNINYVESDEKYVCDDCLDSEYEKCENCGEYFRRYNGYTIHDGYGGTYVVCEDCYSNGDYSCCDECGDYFESDYCHWHNDYCYCDDCYQTHGGGLYGYHDFQDWQLFKSDKEENPSYYIGKEIELEPKNYSNVSSVLNAIENNINAVGMHDGSLKDGGVEVVTHPESWQYLQEHKQDYINFFDEINKLEYGNDGGCGLHFHVTKPNENVISRVIVLLESFKDEIKKLSRRSDNQLRSWSKFLSDGQSDSEKIKYQSPKWLKDKYLKCGHDRYYALNLCNSKTIEFRFFNGVNTFEQYWGALQFIHNLMDIALDEKREIETINWQDLLVGEELREQARKRDVLDTDKFARNTDDIIEKLEQSLAKAKEEIARTLKNLAKYVNKEMSEMDLKQIKTANIEDIGNKVEQFMTTFNYRRQYLEKITMLYNYLTKDNSLDMENIKSYWSSTKMQYPNNTKRYARYGKLIEKTIKNYESEVK